MMKKYLMYSIALMFCAPLHGMEVEEVIMAEPTRSILLMDDSKVEIPESLAEQSVTLRNLLKDLPEGEEVIPLPGLTADMLTLLVSYHKGEDLSEENLANLSALLNSASYLDYKGQYDIANLVINALSRKENGKNFLEGKINLSGISGTDLLKAQLMQKMEPCLIEFASAQEPKTLKGDTRHIINSGAFSLDGKYVVTGSYKTAKIWDVETGKVLKRLSGHRKPITSVAFSPNGKYVITGSADNTAKIWDVETGKELRTLAGHTSSIRTVFSPDAKYVITTGSDNKIIRIWDIKTGKEKQRLIGRKPIWSVAFSPDSKYVVIGYDDGTARIWDIKTGKKLRTLTGHTDTITSVAYSLNGRYVVTGSYDNTAGIWDIKTGKKLRTLSGHTKPIRSLSFSPDGKYVATRSSDRTVKLWYLADEELNRALSNSSLGQVLLTYFSCMYPAEVNKYRSKEFVEDLINSSSGKVQELITYLLF